VENRERFSLLAGDSSPAQYPNLLRDKLTGTKIKIDRLRAMANAVAPVRAPLPWGSGMHRHRLGLSWNMARIPCEIHVATVEPKLTVD
jgi:hypothetical protein